MEHHKSSFVKLGQPDYLFPHEAIDTSKEKKSNLLDMPALVLDIILDKLIDIKDSIRFGAVCQSMYNHCLLRQPSPARCQLPLLLFPTEDYDYDNQTRSLYSLSEKKIICNNQLIVPHHKFCRGSTQGWLVTLDENLTDIHLLNPFLSTHNKIELPPLSAFPHKEGDNYNEGFLGKAVLSANPLFTDKYIVMAIYGDCNRLAYYMPGDKAWTALDVTYTVIEDVIYYRDQFYAVDYHGAVYCCDMKQPNPKIVKVAHHPPNVLRRDKIYLVDSSGDLLQIRRALKDTDVDTDNESYLTIGFEIFKLDLSTSKWSQLKSLGDRALFLGDNCSMSLSSLDYPACTPDCIYFTDDNVGFYNEDDGPHDFGVFNFTDGIIRPYCLFQSKSIYPPPIWIEPTLQRHCK